ncbi:MAG: CRISPR system precrRNA processing endoribonuclease RAMP protein Cas6 [Leptospiraceae bacterium]|nr:CRISPR system precrRNA processing endoribonuclease RAMP protein Cas6 [Leptospiraceae bacterium]MCP5499792.1 CRISPR system precrRNA processing endoribonuclease RAMP protein Cas6 [Leptospiraceae bacterium]
MLNSRLNFSRITVELISMYECRLPEFTGSLLRGSFGHALKKVFCEQYSDKCSECSSSSDCGYFQIFESQDDNFRKMGYHYKPHPYIITPCHKSYYKVGDKLQFKMTFFGDFIRFFPYLSKTFEEMGKVGFGKDRNTFSLSSIRDDISGKELYSEKDKMAEIKTLSIQEYARKEFDRIFRGSNTGTGDFDMVFLTPGRFAENGKVLKSINGKLLFDSINRRYSTMHSFYGEFDRKDISGEEEVQITVNDCSYKKWNRYSNRQERKVQQSGILGTYTLKNISPRTFQILKAMEILHIGKNTSFGLGKIEIRMDDCKNS